MDVKHYDPITKVEFDNSLILVHRNIRCLTNKSDEIINLLKMTRINPHVLSFTKHHMVKPNLAFLI